jgi:hypothetical protein
MRILQPSSPPWPSTNTSAVEACARALLYGYDANAHRLAREAHREAIRLNPSLGDGHGFGPKGERLFHDGRDLLPGCPPDCTNTWSGNCPVDLPKGEEE